jgi:hypothetical protein
MRRSGPGPVAGRAGVDRVRLSVAACALWAALYAAWLAVRPGGDEAGRLFSDLAYLVPLAAAAAAALAAARLAPAGLRRFWALVGLACAFWLAGEVLWSAHDLATGSVPFPWLTDALYLWFYPLVGLALVLVLRPQLGSVGAGRLLDAAVAAGSLGLLWWWLVLSPLPISADLASAAAVVGPALALLLLGLLVAVRLLPSRQGTLGVTLVGAGLLVGTVTDGIYTRAAVTHSYHNGSWMELGWQAEALLYALGAVVSLSGLDDRPDWSRIREPRPTSLLALAGAFAVAAAGVASAAVAHDLASPLVAAAAGLAALAAARAVSLVRAPELPLPVGAFSGKLGPLRLHDEVSRLVHRASRIGRPVALLVADTDALLEPGDGVRRRIAACAGAGDGEGEDVLDLGAGQFGLLLPDADEADAGRVAASVRRELARAGSDARVATAIAGPGERPETLIARARAAVAALDPGA